MPDNALTAQAGTNQEGSVPFQADIASLQNQAERSRENMEQLAGQQSYVVTKGALLGTAAAIAGFFAPAFTFLKTKTPTWRWGGATVTGAIAGIATGLIAMEIMARRLFSNMEENKARFDEAQKQLAALQPQGASQPSTQDAPAADTPETPAPEQPEPSRIREILAKGTQHSKADTVTQQRLETAGASQTP